MKFLQVTGLAALTNCMSVRAVGDFVIDGRIEAYSCKSTEEDRALGKLFLPVAAPGLQYVLHTAPRLFREGARVQGQKA